MRSATVFRAVVKRSLVTGALVCCLVLVVVAAPALSFVRYRPEPVDFSMAAPAGALLGNAARQRRRRGVRAAARARSASTSWG